MILKARMTGLYRGGLCLKQLPYFTMRTPQRKACLQCNQHIGWKQWSAGIRWCDRYCKLNFLEHYGTRKIPKWKILKGCLSDYKYPTDNEYGQRRK